MIIAALPAYNEEIAIGSVILRAKHHVDRVVVIDDGSNDATALVAELAGADVVRHESNKGYGGSLQSCFNMAKELDCDILVILDADGQHNPDDIPSLIVPIIDGEADVVIGSRFVNREDVSSDIPAYRKIGMRILDTVTNAGSGITVSDSQSGFRAYSKKAIHAIKINNIGMSAGSEILMQTKTNDLTIAEVPVKCRYDVENGSSEHPLKHGVAVFMSIIGYIGKKRPLTFFGIPGLIALAVGLVLGWWVVDIYTKMHEVAIGSALITILLLLSGMFSIFAGMMMYVMVSTIDEQAR